MSRLSARVGSPWVWSLFALVMLVAPQLFTSGLSVTMLSQMGIAIIACLSYNMLLGQGGMLSFGHAVYTGLGAFVAIHALNRYGGGALPVSLVPLVGGFAGMGFAVLFGYVTTRKSGKRRRKGSSTVSMNTASRSKMSTSGVVTSPWVQRGKPISAIFSKTGITLPRSRTPPCELVVAPAG